MKLEKSHHFDIFHVCTNISHETSLVKILKQSDTSIESPISFNKLILNHKTVLPTDRFSKSESPIGPVHIYRSKSQGRYQMHEQKQKQKSESGIKLEGNYIPPINIQIALETPSSA